jgi:two-component system phosphate regulon sensor histidine kinase PhoR
MKSEFLANVSHELRTPLTPIIGYSEILQKKAVSRERSQEFAAGILESARRLERIVAMLVDFSAIEGGRLSITAEPTQVRPLITEAIKAWKGRATDHRFSVKMDKELPSAFVDAQLVRRTLDELLDNAVKYSPGGGTISVSATSENSRKRRMLKIDVADQGIGIEPEDLSGVFEDFRQVDASVTRAYGGLGLGLAFVKRIVEAHGGTIGAESEPGRGTVFSFTLPAASKTGRSARS